MQTREQIIQMIAPIRDAVCSNFGVRPEDVMSRCRIRYIVEARFALMARISEDLHYSEGSIGHVFGVTRKAVAHAIARCKDLRDVDSKYRTAYQRSGKN
jgi:chromosomal replication initiation ATPase DnaA